MKYLAAAFLVGFLAFQIEEPPEYPAGVMCSPAGDVAGGHIIASDHPCHCKNMASPDTSCEMPTTNDPVCKQYCHEKHCGCPLMCDGSH